MNSRPLDLMAAQVASISSIRRSYISDFATCRPIGVLSPLRPKYPANGFSQMTCLPARTAATIIAACSIGGVQMSTTSIARSASRSSKLRQVVPIPCLRANATT